MSVPHFDDENVLEMNWLKIVNFRSTEMESVQSLARGPEWVRARCRPQIESDLGVVATASGECRFTE